MNFNIAFPFANDVALLLLRLMLGIVFWMHGMMKRAMWKMEPSEKMPSGLLYTIRALSITEPLGAVAIVLGILSPIPLIGFCAVMIGAILIHRKMNVTFISNTTTGWEVDFMVLLVSITLLLIGPGKFSVDYLIFN